MPVEIKYFNDGYGIELVGKGVVTGQEIYDANIIVYSGDTLLKQKYQIINFANVEKLDVSQEEAVRLANQDIEASRTNPNIVIAVVAALNHAFGLGRMWEAHVNKSDFETMVFRRREEAVAWINKKIADQE
jgi:hypothetical protein